MSTSASCLRVALAALFLISCSKAVDPEPGCDDASACRETPPTGQHFECVERNCVLAEDPRKPSAPQQVEATPTLGGMRLAWQAPQDAGTSPVVHYTVVATPGALSRTTAQTSLTFDGLSRATEYTFAVTASNAHGTSEASAPTPPLRPYGPPGPVTEAAATAGVKSLSVSWTAPADSGGPPVTYRVSVPSEPGALITISGTAAQITGLRDGTPYAVEILALNGLAESAAVSTPEVTTFAAPSPPGSLTATAFLGSARLTWSAPPFNGGTPLTGYVVSYEPGGGHVTLPATATSATLEPLSFSTEYTFTVRATNAVGEGPASTPARATTPCDIQFATAATGATEINPNDVITAHFNADGILDVAAVNRWTNTVSVFLGTGGGTLAPENHYIVGSSPDSLLARDFDADGDQDLAVVNFDGHTLSVLLGNGAGTFGAAATYPTGPLPASIVSADLNQDGKLDLAVANTGAGCCSGFQAISFLAGRGDGTFAAYINVYAGTSSATEQLAIGDFDRDGKPDLASFSLGGRVTLNYYSGGRFWATTLVDASPWVQDFVAADFDSDGWLDILSANFLNYPNGWNRLEALWSNGSGSFVTPVVPLREGDSPTALASGDFNGDGHLDVALTDYLSGSVRVLAGDGDGGFVAPRTAAVGTAPVGLTAADVDADGRLDLVAANFGSNTVTVLRNTCGP